MASQSKADELSRVISDLKKQRDEYLAQIERIDATFEQYGIDPDSLSGGTTARRKKSAGKKASTKKASKKKATRKKAAKKKAGRKKGTRKKRATFERTGEESVLAFVKYHGKPTAKEVNEHWQAEGRGGKADNALSKLVKENKLKRVSAPGERGSRYQVK